jgi:hypothetical protein
MNRSVSRKLKDERSPSRYQSDSLPELFLVWSIVL